MLLGMLASVGEWVGYLQDTHNNNNNNCGGSTMKNGSVEEDSCVVAFSGVIEHFHGACCAIFLIRTGNPHMLTYGCVPSDGYATRCPICLVVVMSNRADI
jgi:hypothetical protein